MNLKNPADFNEKLMWLKLNWKNPLIVQCADKFEVRDYIIKCGFLDLLPDLYGVYEKPDDIEWDKLPEKFVLKCTNGCGCNIICHNKKELDINDALSMLGKWIKSRYVFEALELHYDKIIPRIICEEFIQTSDGLLPNDYKIYCFNGEPKITLVCTDRNTNLKLKFMDLNWNEMDIGNEAFLNKEVPRKPKWFNEMINVSRELSRPFPFVRIDFYDRDDKLIFGEMTFTPAGCAARYYNNNGLTMLGNMIKLPEKYK